MAQGIGIAILWVFLYGYLIIASIDFGAGFFAHYELITQKEHIISRIIKRYLSPVWEVTNVFFVFFFVGIVGFFPETAYYYGTALLVPGSIALVLLAIRGAFYAFYHYGVRENKAFSFFYGATGLFIPAALSTALTISEGGYIDVVGGHVVLRAGRLFASFYSWAVVFLAIVSVLYISAMFLTYYAAKAGDQAALEKLRGYALFWSLPTILASALIFVTLQRQNPTHFNHILDIWWMFLLSLCCFLVAVTLVFQKKHYGLAFFFVLLQFFFAFFGYGISHLPYILYPYIRIEAAFTLPTMGRALMFAFAMGLALLIPSLILLMRLFIFDAKYVKGEQK
ncbi:cytochrome d ubiquinol oxidase subunit II [Camelliibacillus cellulosilyticus]|uniref:Cytochrome d ubiquinol oxidase subunit II n=1 Tax=Camelliibacillus cellulosilyticus TaxID=2174486 RepID=A0ABV9GJA5_9BACL